MASDRRHVEALEKRLRDGITSQLQGVVLNGASYYEHRYPGNFNLSFAYVEGESLIMGLKVGDGSQAGFRVLLGHMCVRDQG